MRRVMSESPVAVTVIRLGMAASSAGVSLEQSRQRERQDAGDKHQHDERDRDLDLEPPAVPLQRELELAPALLLPLLIPLPLEVVLLRARVGEMLLGAEPGDVRGPPGAPPVAVEDQLRLPRAIERGTVLALEIGRPDEAVRHRGGHPPARQ